MGPGSPLTVTTIRVRGRRELRAPGPLDAPCQAPLARRGSATPVWGSRWDGTEIPPWGRGWCGQTGPRAAQPGSSTRGNRGVLLLEGSEGRGSGGLVGPLLWLGWGEISCSLCPTLIMMVPLETRAPPATLGGDAPTQSLPTPALPLWTLGPPDAPHPIPPSGGPAVGAEQVYGHPGPPRRQAAGRPRGWAGREPRQLLLEEP